LLFDLLPLLLELVLRPTAPMPLGMRAPGMISAFLGNKEEKGDGGEW
jgi:hypothetical protein